MIVSSSNFLPIICIPIGSPLLSIPQGIDIPGNPAIFTETVHISAKYISIGFVDFSPNLNAVVGDVGVTITSYFSNALLNSFITSVLTC